MAGGTDGLQVFVVVGAVLELGDDVIHRLGRTVSARRQAHLAEALVPTEDALANAIPTRPVPALMPRAATGVGELAGFCVSPVVVAERTGRGPLTAPRMPAGL